MHLPTPTLLLLLTLPLTATAANKPSPHDTYIFRNKVLKALEYSPINDGQPRLPPNEPGRKITLWLMWAQKEWEIGIEARRMRGEG